jgi:hypothetical protein
MKKKEPKKPASPKETRKNALQDALRKNLSRRKESKIEPK